MIGLTVPGPRFKLALVWDRVILTTRRGWEYNSEKCRDPKSQDSNKEESGDNPSPDPVLKEINFIPKIKNLSADTAVALMMAHLLALLFSVFFLPPLSHLASQNIIIAPTDTTATIRAEMTRGVSPKTEPTWNTTAALTIKARSNTNNTPVAELCRNSEGVGK